MTANQCGDMNLTNQINAGLNDVRKTLLEYAKADSAAMTDTNPHEANTRRNALQMRATYELNAIEDMISEFHEGRRVPWSDRREMVVAEFGELEMEELRTTIHDVQNLSFVNVL